MSLISFISTRAFLNHDHESRSWRDLRNLQNHACSRTTPRVWKHICMSHTCLVNMLMKKNGKFTLYIAKLFTLPFLHSNKYDFVSHMKSSIAHRRYIVLAQVFGQVPNGGFIRGFAHDPPKKLSRKKNPPPNLYTAVILGWKEIATAVRPIMLHSS